MDSDRAGTRPERVFVGRGLELATLSAAMAAARAGEPQVVLLEGDAGIGKSSLISEFLDGQRDVPFFAASGEEAEAFLPYGLVQQLAAGAVAVSARALAGLELLSAGPRPDADPLKVGVELLALISALQEGAAAVVVIEDLQWADLASARALLFACRRLSADRVLVVLSCRPGGTSQLGEGWERFVNGDRRATRLALGGLNVDELGMLCRALGRTGLSDRTFRRLKQYTGGNPLLARALLAELTDDLLNEAGDMVQAPRSLAEVVQHRLAALGPAARELVAAAAVLREHCTLVDAAAVAGTTAPAAALGEAEQAGILLEQQTPSGWRIAFPHLLVRQAVYGYLGAQRRRALHLRAAAVLAGESALGHRAAAAAGADPGLAGDLDEAARQAAAAGKLRLAARYLQQAAAVSPAGPERDERTLSSFELLVRAADVAQAEAARPAAEALPVTGRRDAALGQLALLAARPMDARALLLAAWDAHDPVADAAAGAEAAVGLGMLSGMSGPFSESAMWLDRALASATGSETWHDTARNMRAIPFTLGGQGDKALSLFDDLPASAAMVPAAKTASVAYRGIVKLWTGDLQGATDDLGVAVQRIRAGLPVWCPGQPLAFLAEAEFRSGRWDDCRADAELAVSLAHDADLHYDLPVVHSAAARVPACRGEWAVAASHVQAAEDAARAFGGLAEILAASARSILGFARDDPGEALLGAATALAVPEIDCYDDPAAFWWRPLQIWALTRTGRLGEAESLLTAFESRAADRGESLALLNAAWLRGSLAVAHGELERADQALRKGCQASAGQPFPFHRALLNLEHGRCLARLRRRKAAIVAVRAADDIFATLAARPFSRAAGAELAALGVRPRGGGERGLPGLTAQELRVARLVASGLSNREAAAQLYLSPKTIEHHLASVFTKLGVSHRHQLAARLPDREGPRIRSQATQGKTREAPDAGRVHVHVAFPGYGRTGRAGPGAALECALSGGLHRDVVLAEHPTRTGHLRLLGRHSAVAHAHPLARRAQCEARRDRGGGRPCAGPGAACRGRRRRDPHPGPCRNGRPAGPLTPSAVPVSMAAPNPFARLLGTAIGLGVTVLGDAGGRGRWPDDGAAAIVSLGEHIALKPGLDEGLRTDVLAMALIAAAVMGDSHTDHPCAITAPAGLVLILNTPVPCPPDGPGKLATLLARACGRGTASAAFEHTAPGVTDLSPWDPWIQALTRPPRSPQRRMLARLT